jgi:hypothetical protein
MKIAISRMYLFSARYKMTIDNKIGTEQREKQLEPLFKIAEDLRKITAEYRAFITDIRQREYDKPRSEALK